MSASIRTQRALPRTTWTAALALIVAGIAQAADPQDLERLEQSGDCRGCDLSGADLRNRDLRGGDFSGANLRDARLADADLRGARLVEADLRGVALHKVRLTGANLRRADLRHLDADIDLEFVVLVGVRLEGARFDEGVVCGPPPEKGGFGCTTSKP